MLRKKRYPNIRLRSKKDIAKSISGKELPFPEALKLIDDVIENFDKYWYDSNASEPAKEKYVRSSVGRPLGKLLKLIDQKILATNDKLVPEFIFGGVSKRNHIQAVRYLLGEKNKRSLIKLDVQSFFEQISQVRVFYFFYKKCGCSPEVSRILSTLCCVPRGPKGSTSIEKTIARGFPTSPRLAMWCNLDLFTNLQWKIKKKLKEHDPRIAIYVDDIGITASRVNEKLMEEVSDFAENMLKNFDKNQSLPINSKKKQIISSSKQKEILGLRIGKKRVSLGNKTRSRKAIIAEELKKPHSIEEKKRLLEKRDAYYIYQKSVKKKEG